LSAAFNSKKTMWALRLSLLVLLLVVPPWILPAQDRFHSMVPPGYHSYEEIIALADSLAENYPEVCRKILFGTSLGGRQLAALEISDSVTTDEGEPKILFDGGCHGDEIGGSENLIRFARDLCTRYGTDSLVTDLVNTREIWLYLMVNPDGRVNLSRFNGAMVDINRDYGYMWNGAGGSPAVFSQPETRGVRTCMEQRPYSLYISYHSGFQQAAYPWAYRQDPAPDIPNLYTLAMRYSASSLYSGLAYGQSYNIMYQAHGMSVDYFYGTTGQACFTMEISTNKQPPDPETYYAWNYPAMLEMIREAGWGVSGSVQDSLTGQPISAAVWVDFFFPVSTGEAGDFHKFLLPGVHTLRVAANGYKTRAVAAFAVPQQGSVPLEIKLVPDSGLFGMRVCSVSIPGDNPSDPAWTPGSLEAPDQSQYSLGVNGWIVLDLGDTLTGENNLTVHEAGNPDEGFTCYGSLSEDGPFEFLGTGSGTASFSVGPENPLRYVRIMDDGDGNPLTAGAGYDLDAVSAHSGPVTGEKEPGAGQVFILYPNPATDVIFMNITGSAVKQVTMLDSRGKRVFSADAPHLPLRIDVSGLAGGAYFCVVRTPASTRIRKVVIIR
jgi:hypothetical protein